MNATRNADKQNEKTLLVWVRRYVETRGHFPQIAPCMFVYPHTVDGRAVRCTVTGLELAVFSSLDAAYLAISRCRRAVSARVAELAADSI